MGQRRNPDQPRKLKRSVSMTEEMARDIEAQAEAEGHRNFSAIIVAAVREYLMRALLGKKAA